MPPRKSKVTRPLQRSLRTTARKSVIPTFRPDPDPDPPGEIITMDSVDHANAALVEELEQQREWNSLDYCRAGPATSDVNVANSGPFRPEISSELETDRSIETLVRSGPLRPEIGDYNADGEMVVERKSLGSERRGSGSVRPEVHGYGAEVMSKNNCFDELLVRSCPLRPQNGDHDAISKMGVEPKSLESKGAGLGSVRPEVYSDSTGVEPKNSGIETVGPEGIANAVNGGNESLKEQVTTSVGGSSGKRTVVKRVVRVVRKVVRKKVPKRGVEGVGEERKNDDLEMTGSVSEAMGVKNASSSGINRTGMENSKPNDSVVSEATVAATSVVKEHSLAANYNAESNDKELEVVVKEDSSGLGEVKTVVEKSEPNVVVKGALANEEQKKVEETMNSDEANENIEPEMNVSESMIVDKENSGGSTEMEECKNNDAVLLGVKNEGSGNAVIKSMVIEKYGSVVDGNAETEGPMEARRLEDPFGSKNKDPSEKLPVSDKPVLLEGERTPDWFEMSAPARIVPLEGERSQDQLEKKNVGALGYNTTDAVEDQDIVPMVESSSGEHSKGVKEPVEDDSDRLNRGLVWSGEMEALERRKRRKTEIFVGGLGKDAKEENIRKVFEDVGEIVEVRLVMNSKTGKNKGFAFVRYASAADAKKALTKYSKVEICGKECGVTPVEGNDTLFLGNINRNWKSEDIVKLLKEAGIKNIDKVTVIADPNNVERNRGFAFVELETCKDAQSAFHKLQTKDAFGSHQQIKVAWAQPLIEPDEEELLKVRSVYAEYLPCSWGEEEVKDYFKRFGEIENVTLAKSLASSRRKDFAFVNYTSRDAALACVKAFSREQIDNDGLKVKVKVSLAKPMPKSKQTKHLPNATTKELPKEKRKAAQPIPKPHVPRNKRKPTGNSYEDIMVKRRPSTTEELVQLLRRQAVSRQAESGLSIGSAVLGHQFPSLVSKRPFSAVVHDLRSSDPRGLPPLPLGRSYPIQSVSLMPSGVSIASSSYHHQQGISYASESVSGVGDYPSRFQTRPQAFYYGRSGVHRQFGLTSFRWSKFLQGVPRSGS